MKLIFLPKSGEKISAGDPFPLIEIPTNEGGEKTSLNDFQWWAPTEKWKEWLKKNPREWKAEAEDFSDDSDLIFEFEEKYESDIMSFDKFNSLLEKEEGGISEEEASKRYIKFMFAYNKLNEENKINNELDLETLPSAEKYAFILDLSDEEGNAIPESRNAYAFKKIKTAEEANFYLAELSETILTGEIEEDKPLWETFNLVANMVGKTVGAGVLGIAVVAIGLKIVKSIVIRSGLSRLITKILPKAASNAKGAKNFGFLTRFIRGAKFSAQAIIPAIKAARGTKGVIPAIKAARTAFSAARTAAQGAKTAGQAAKGSNPIGWIIAAATAIQHFGNWMGTNQAPRFSDIKNAGIDAMGSFSPASIETGRSITVCWTQDSQGFLATLASFVWASDTRTTMEIIKLGNFSGKSLFYLVDVHSESMKKMLQENSMIILAFEEGAKFERGILDNDDIDLEYINIENAEDIAASTFFQGYCKWDEIQQEYNEADDRLLIVDENAPETYSFNFIEEENNRIVNVRGKLVPDVSSIEAVESTFMPDESGESNESQNYNAFDGVLSFSEFNSFDGGDLEIFESESEIADEASKTFLTGPVKIAPYRVQKISYADKSFGEGGLPVLNSFLIPSDYLTVENFSRIEVQPVQEVTMKSPKRGTVFIEDEEPPVPTPVPADDDTETPDGMIPVEYTKGAIKVKHRDNPKFLNAIGIPDITKIKDKDRKDKIKLLDVITPEEKKDLDITDWPHIKKVKIYKEGKSGDAYMIKFKSGGLRRDRSRKIKSDNPNFDVALKVADRILSTFKEKSEDEEE